jgi:beta-glucosidase
MLSLAAAAGAAAPLEQRVEALLKRMSIEEKVGQMTQVAIDVVLKKHAPDAARHEIDPARLDDAVLRHHVGSILNVAGRAYTVENWHELINQIQDAAGRTRLKIPVIYGIDAVHGANYTIGATLFPQAIAMAATWNPDLMRRSGEIAAYQVRASGNFYPVMDLARMPVWPRLWETFGEDSHLASEMGRAYIQGLQGQNIGAPDKAAACLKHYAGYGSPLSGQDRTPAWIDTRMMHQYSLAPFEAAIRAGAPTVMVNSGEVNGIPGHANHYLLTEVLKRQWGFEGFVVSDWEDVKRLHTRDQVAETPKDAVRMAVVAGVDMSMVPLDYTFYDLLLECVKDGSVPVARIDDAVRRILRVKFRLGLFENARPDPALKAAFHKPEFEAANLAAAREAITLLKNRNRALPLARNRRILVTGPTADMLSVLNGGWTITWQGDREDLYPKDKLTIVRAIEAAVGKKNVTYVPGTTFDRPVDISAAASAAARADVVIACLGEKAYCETPGNINDLTLEAAQFDLVRVLAGTGKPIVVVLAQGRPRIIREIVPLAEAIVMAYLPGLEGGRAVADVLFGEVNPSGRLPFTYPRFPNALTTYDYKVVENAGGNRVQPEFEFGHGLSYTTFEYSGLALSSETLTAKGELQVSVTVRNTGARTGKEVVQLYVSDLYRSISPPARELKAFKKVDLAAGASEKVTFTLRPRDLAFVGLNNRWVTEPGRFRVSVGGLSREFTHR